MKIRKTLFATLLLSALSVVAVAQKQKQAPPEGGTPRDFQLPAKKTSKLDNGMGITLVPYGAVPKVNISVIVKTGNVHERENEVWLADFTGNLLHEGTKTMDFKTLAKKVAGMGGEINISTGLNQTVVSGSVLSEYAPELIRIMADVLMNPAFPASEVERLKNDLKRNLSVQKSVPQEQATEKFRSILYKGHAYGRYFPTEAMIDGFTLEKARDFYTRNFGAARSTVYAVGKFDEAAVTNAVKESFGKWVAGPAVDYPVATPVQSSEVAIIDRPGAPQSTVVLGLPTLDPSKPDYLSLQITNSLLGGSFGSRITTNIREDKGYTYSPHSAIVNGYRSAMWFEEADVTTEHTGASLREISKEIKHLQQEAPSADELKGIQNYEAGIFVLQNSTPEGIISQLNFIDFHGLDESYLTDRVKNIHAVTPAKVQQMANDYFKYENMTLVLVGDKKLLEKQMKEHEKSLKNK